MSVSFIEKHKRTIAKLVSWRVAITASNTMAGYLASGDWMVGLKVAGVALIVNSTIFWLHERLWNGIQWAKEVKVEEDNVKQTSTTI
jgi:uncharacterized membrane protein